MLTCNDFVESLNSNDSCPASSATGNPDVSGLGVLLAFLISAWACLAFAIGCYLTNRMPRDLLTDYDVRIMRRSYQASRDWERTLQRAMLALSDQQMVAGIAVLIAGFAGWTTMTVYHWQVVTYLGWLSSNVHLTTLSFLRDYLRQNMILRRLRLVGMALLIVLLIVALVPTITNFWTATLYAKSSGVIPACWAAQLPVWCTTGTEAEALGAAIMETKDGYETLGPSFADVNPDAVVSYIILIGGFLWKAGNLAETTQGLLQKWFWRYPMAALERPLRNLAQRKQSENPSWRARCLYCIFISVYVPIVSLTEILRSFAGNLWTITIALVWGSLQLCLPRFQVNLSSSEDTWDFGQILPLLLLALPLLTVVETLYEKDHNRTSSDDYQLRTGITDDSYIGLLGSTGPQSTGLTDVPQAEPGLSKVFAQLQLDKADSAADLRTALYDSRMFKAVLLLWQFFFLLAFGYVVGMKVVFANQTYDLQLEAAIGGLFLWIGLMSTWFVTMLSVRWSRLYR